MPTGYCARRKDGSHDTLPESFSRYYYHAQQQHIITTPRRELLLAVEDLLPLPQSIQISGQHGTSRDKHFHRHAFNAYISRVKMLMLAYHER